MQIRKMPMKQYLQMPWQGDATVFARQDYVEEAWRIVDPYLSSDTPVYEYDPQTWGPAEVAQTTET